MWWKVYYWLIILVTILSIIGLAGGGTNSLLDLIVVADGLLALIGLRAFLYRKKVFSPTFWYYFFWVNIVWNIAFLAYGLAPNDPILRNLSFLNTVKRENMNISPFVAIIFSLLDIPMLYAIYKLGRLSKK